MAIIGFMMLPEPGHLNPSFKLAKDLKSRGHHLCYFGPAGTEKYVNIQGIRFISIHESFYPPQSKVWFMEGPSEPAATPNPGGHIHLNEDCQVILFGANLKVACDLSAYIGQAIEDLSRKFKGSRIEMLIFDPSIPMTAMVADQMGIQTVALSTNLLLPYDFVNKINHPSSRFKLPVLFLCPREFAGYPPAALAEGEYFYIEPSIDIRRKEVPFPWHMVDENKPLIYCSLGSQSHRFPEGKQFIQTVIDAARIMENRQLVITIGNHFNAQDFRDVPSNVVLAEQAPQLKMLRRASIMITHGGLGAVKECILFSVPMIVYPFDADQPSNASRVVAQGVGLSGDPRSISVGTIRSLIDRIENDPSFRMRVEDLGKKFREIEYSCVGVQTIEQLLKRNSNRSLIGYSSKV